MHTSLLFGIHCHQPIDNFGWVIEEAIEKSYKPFFTILKEFPQFKCSVHFSGWLLEFIENNDKELFSLMQSLTNQLEFFSGGYYEPVLASIPSKDRIGQIQKLNRYIKKHFNQQPKGLWLTERVWDDSIVNDLNVCGIKYVIVDDYHLITSGVNAENLNGYFITESGGDSIALFPISQKLRYAIPFYDLKKTNEILNEFKNENGKNGAIIFDDGEKFGIWPKTYETVYEKEWLRDFFTQTLADENIQVETFNEFYSSNPPISLAYLPTVSYAEMGHWSLNSDHGVKLEELLKINPDNQQFIRGATWKNFLTKYQEANWIHKRFIELSKKQTNQIKYKDALYKAQCNDALWHGVFGGVYLPNLRDNAYTYIIECEKLLENGKEKLDIDLDGYEEYKYNTKDLLTIVSTKYGGQIFELDLLDKNFNLQNTLTRYEELYHKKIEIKQTTDENVIENEIATIHDNKLTIDENIFIDYDWYFKKSAIDHIVDKDIALANFRHNIFKEYGDFVNQPYEVVKTDSKRLQLKRDGGIYLDKKYDTKLEKKYQFINSKINLDVSIDSSYQKELKYIQEWNLHFASLKNVLFNDQIIDNNEMESFIIFNDNILTIKDSYLNKTIIFSFDKEIEIAIFPLNSVSQSEQGVDLTNQGVTLVFLYDFTQNIKNTLQVVVE